MPPSPPLLSSSGVALSDRCVLTALCLGTFLASFMFSAPTPFFPSMARELHVSVPLLGQMTSTMLLLSAALGLVIGPLADRLGFRPLILIGTSAAALTLVDIGLAPTFFVLLLSSVTGAVADAAGLGPSLALAGTHFTGEASGRAIGWTNGTAALTAIFGIPLLTAIAAIASWRVAFIALGFAALTVVALVFRWLPRHQFHSSQPLCWEAIFAPYRPLLRQASMRRLYAARALSAACWMGFLTYLGAFLTQGAGIAPGQIGLVYMVAGSAFFLGSVAVGGVLARFPTRPLVAAGYLTMALLMAITFSARVGAVETGALIAAAAFAMGIGMAGIVTLFLAETPSGAGTTVTLGGSLFNIGAAIGGAIGGLLLAVGGYDAIALGLPLFGLVAAFLSWHRAAGSRER